MDFRVQAIRNDKLVGNDTFTTIDECWDENELIEALDNEHITTTTKAVHWARCLELGVLENATNHRLGSDDDPEIIALENFQKAMRDTN